jgi:hypothetical protein
VAGEECDGRVVVGKDGDGRGWVTPWGQRIDCSDGSESGEGLESCPADYCDFDRI